MSGQSIVILTGAGISAESGLLTFRDNGGLWCGHRVEDVATPEAFARNPVLVHEFYNQRRAQLAEVTPNPAHLALARLSAEWPGEVTLITQNVDDLHARAGGSYTLIQMHGKLKQARCIDSEKVIEWDGGITTGTPCPCCHVPGKLRPHIVWFGEMPLYMGVIGQALRECDLFLSIGTSGNVYPAAGFAQEVRHIGRAHTAELNLEPSLGGSLFHEKIYGRAGDIVPAYVERILAGEVI